MTTFTPEQIRINRETRPTWYGCLADDNVEHVAQRIRNLLTDRRYTFVAYNADHAWSMPQVRTGQKIEPSKSTKEAVSMHRMGDVYPHWTGEDETKTWETAGITVVDTYGVWSISSHFATESDAYQAYQDEEKKKHDQVTRITIEGGANPNENAWRGKIEIVQYNYMSPRERLHWVIAVEPPIDEES